MIVMLTDGCVDQKSRQMPGTAVRGYSMCVVGGSCVGIYHESLTESWATQNTLKLPERTYSGIEREGVILEI